MQLVYGIPKEYNGGKKKSVDIRRSTSFDALAEFLGTVVLVQEVMGNLLQIGQMAVEESAANGEEIRVALVLDFYDTPWVLSSSHLAATDLEHVLGADNGEWHE